MVRDDRKKERHRLKRKAKRDSLRRLHGRSPYQRIGSGGTVEACLINDGWRERGLAVICVLRRAGAAGYAFATFLIDLWCAGLKDAWGRIDITREQFGEVVDKMPMHLIETDLETARALVAASVRFARQNGFRLPPRYERWTPFVGGISDWAAADLSDFGIDGKLRWVGPIEDLRSRLIGCSVDEFLARKDVDFILGYEERPGGDDDDDDETAAVDEVAEQVQSKVIEAARRWCFANGERPHPRLEEAAGLTMESIFQVQAPGDDDDEEDFTDAASQAATENLGRFVSIHEPDHAGELEEALGQFERFISSFSDPQEFYHAMGIQEAEE